MKIVRVLVLATAAAACGGGGGAGSDDGGGADAFGGAAGPPIEAPPGEWTWVSFPEAKCRDGSATGIGIFISPGSDGLAIYLEGGGACFNGITCISNPSSFDASDFDGRSGGIWDRDNPENPMGAFSHVYVPYCSGDVHAGLREDVDVPEGGPAGQQFVGYRNMTMYLERIVPTFPGLGQVVLTGSSAGGFGSSANLPQVQRYFGGVPVTMIDDSGPAMSVDVISPCFQDLVRELWNLDATLLAECGAACPTSDDFLEDYAVFLANAYADRAGGLISSIWDNVIRFFYGFGYDDCSFVGPMPADAFEAGLYDLRDRIWADAPNIGTFYIESSDHVWLGRMYSTTVDGVLLADWIADLVDGAASHVAP